MVRITGTISTGRRVEHPGKPAPNRFSTHAAPAADELALTLAPGNLFDTIVGTLAEAGFDHASLQIYDGDLAEAFYQVAPPDPKGEKAVAYGPPIPLPGGATIVFATATLGHKDGGPIIHCHGVMRDRQGRLYGGHFPTDLCVIGERGVPAWAWVSMDQGFVVRPDEETAFSLLAPYEGTVQK